MSDLIYFRDGDNMRAVSKDNPLPVTGGGGSGGSGLTDAELRASPVPMVPTLTGGAMVKFHIPSTAIDDATAVAVTAQACHQATIANISNEIVWVGHTTGAFFPVFPRAYFTFFGLQNLSAIRVWCAAETDIHIRVES